MDDTRYAPPGTPLHEVGVTAAFAAPRAVLTKLRIALAGVILYAVYTVIRALADPHEQKIVALMLVSPVVMLALAAGLGLKSRICALLLLAYVVVPRAMVYVKMGRFAWSGVWLLLIGVSCLGVYATFEYHLLRRRAESRREDVAAQKVSA